MEYAYRVMNGAGRIINGKFEADHESMVIEALLKQGFYIISINKEQGSKPIKINWFNKVRPLELLTMTRQLAVMLNAGLPLLKALFILIQQTSDHRLKDVLSGIKGHIEKGASLHSALAEYPEVFSPVYIHMVEAGEAGGMLADVLGQLARHLEKVREIRHRLITASVYPAIILFISIIAVVLILKLILPSFVDLFTSSGIELPLATRILLLTGAFLEKNILYIIIGLSALSLLVKRLAKSQFFRYYLDLLAIRNPVTGKIKSLIVGVHFTHTIGTLLKAGIPILKALEIAESVIDNQYMARALSQARKNISEGQSITSPLQATGVFEPLVTQMIGVGEETGNLDYMLINIADFFNQEIMYKLERVMASLEPALILLAALIVGSTVLAVVLPVFQIVSAVSM